MSQSLLLNPHKSIVMISFDIARVVLSGSYHRDISALRAEYLELIGTGCQVLSPHRLDFDDNEFVRDTAEKILSIKEIENHHLTAIAQSDFLWIFAPNGYIGSSAAFEIGYATSLGIPVYSKSPIGDVMLKEFVTTVNSVYQAKQQII